MKARYSEKTDTLYFTLEEARSAYSQEIGEDVRIEYAADGRMVGINIRRARENILRGLISKGKEEVDLLGRIPKSPIKIKIDRDLCLGFASCVAMAPSVFQLDEQSDTDRRSFFLSRAKIEVVDEDSADRETIIRAAQACPTKAIILEDRETGKQIYP